MPNALSSSSCAKTCSLKNVLKRACPLKDLVPLHIKGRCYQRTGSRSSSYTRGGIERYFFGLCISIESRHARVSKTPFWSVTFVARGRSLGVRFPYARLTCWDVPKFKVGYGYVMRVSSQFPQGGPAAKATHLDITLHKLIRTVDAQYAHSVDAALFSDARSAEERGEESVLFEVGDTLHGALKGMLLQQKESKCASHLAVRGVIVHSSGVIEKSDTRHCFMHLYLDSDRCLRTPSSPIHNNHRIRVTVHFPRNMLLANARKIASRRVWTQMGTRVIAYPCRMFDMGASSEDEKVCPGLSLQWNRGSLVVASPSGGPRSKLRVWGSTIPVNTHPDQALRAFFDPVVPNQRLLLFGACEIIPEDDRRSGKGAAGYPVCIESGCSGAARKLALRQRLGEQSSESYLECSLCRKRYASSTTSTRSEHRQGHTLRSQLNARHPPPGRCERVTVQFTVSNRNHHQNLSGETTTIVATCFDRDAKLIRSCTRCWACVTMTGMGLEGIVVEWASPA